MKVLVNSWKWQCGFGPGEYYEQHHEKYALRGETHHAGERAQDEGDLGGDWSRITTLGVTGWIYGGQWTRITVVESEPEPEPEPHPDIETLLEKIRALLDKLME